METSIQTPHQTTHSCYVTTVVEEFDKMMLFIKCIMVCVYTFYEISEYSSAQLVYMNIKVFI